MLEGLEILLGAGIISLIFECLMVLAPRSPKFKEFYTKLVLFFDGTDPFEEETFFDNDSDDIDEAFQPS